MGDGAFPLIEAPLRAQVRPGGSRSKSRAFLICPVCEAPMTIRDSARHNNESKQLTCQCQQSRLQRIVHHAGQPRLYAQPRLALHA
jgi:hypothetical protein